MSVQSTIIQGSTNHELLIKGAIDAALADIRNNLYLLDYVFMWFPIDDLTNNVYGERSRQLAIKWFKSNEIFVSMAYRGDLPKFPLISILPRNHTEDVPMLGDINYETYDQVESTDVGFGNQISLGPFTPTGYDPNTGIVTIPSTLSTVGTVFDGMGFYDSTTNTVHEVTQVTDSTHFVIDKNLKANFINSYVAPISTFLNVSVESVIFKDIYDVYIYSQDIESLFYLEAVLKFILLRYKQQYLEARGFERSVTTIGPVTVDQRINSGVEKIWYRQFTLSGFTRTYWPKTFSAKCQGVIFNKLKIANGKQSPPYLNNQIKNALWESEKDNF